VCAYIDCMLAYVCAIADGVNEEGYPEPELGTEYYEQEPDPERRAGTPRRLRRRQVQSHPLMHALVLVLQT
jgi:hypothetical protein